MTRVSHYNSPNLLNEISKLFDQNNPWQSTDTSNIDTSQWVPAVDIKEEQNQFAILADLPGIDKKDVNISMENNVLTISGERFEEKKENQNTYSRVERVRGSFYRRFVLPDTADGSKIEAQMDKGVLKVIIPKKELAQPRRIEIKDCEK